MIKRVFTSLLILLSLCSFCQEVQRDTALIRLEKELASSTNDYQKMKALASLGAHQVEYDLKNAEAYLLEAQQLAESRDAWSKNLAYIYNQLGVVKRRKANYGESISFYLKSKDIYEKLKDTSNVADVIHNIGLVYRYQMRDSIAVEHFKIAIDLNRKMKDSFSLAAAYNMIGVSYRRQNMIDSALANYTRARNLFEQLGLEEDVVGVDSNLAVVYSITKQYEKSLPIKLTNLDYYKKIGKKMSICVAYIAVSKDYSRLKRFELAKKYADSSLHIALEQGFKERITYAYLRRSVTHRQMKNFEQAYEDYRMYKKYSDSIYGLQSAERVRELELQHQLGKELNEFETLSKKRQDKVVLYSILFVVTLLLGGAVGYLIWRNYTARVRIVANKLEKAKLTLEK